MASLSCEPPILQKLVYVKLTPLLNETQGAFGEKSIHRAITDGDAHLVFCISGVKMWRFVIAVLHENDNTEESAELCHAEGFAPTVAFCVTDQLRIDTKSGARECTESRKEMVMQGDEARVVGERGGRRRGTEVLLTSSSDRPTVSSAALPRSRTSPYYMSVSAPSPKDTLLEALTQALGAQYDITRLLGRGGMGAVYLGRERLLERFVAIKVLPHAGDESDADARDRFLREARTAARLTHPSIVPLYSFGEAGGTLFYIMGYVEGESLEQRLRRDGRLAADVARRIITEIASALDHAHSMGIVHRDLKPDNVMLDATTGRAYLTDFGIAKHRINETHALTRTGVVVGTPHYMSPEQAAGDRNVDGRSDIYALGVMSYRMLAGRLPFEGGSLRELIAQHVSAEPVRLSSLLPDVPHDLEMLVSRAMAKEPEKRWPSGAAVVSALSSGDDEAALPEDLEKWPGQASFNVMLAWMLTAACACVYAFTRDDFWLLGAAGGLAGDALSMTSGLLRGRRHGIPWRRMLRLGFYPPRWWSFWWPRGLRRPGDLWHRLPAPVRRVRIAATAGVVYFAGLFMPSLLIGIGLSKTNELLAVSKVLVLGGLAGGGIAGLLLLTGAALSVSWAKRYGLSARDADKLRTVPPWGTKFWGRPEIARLLESPAAMLPATEAPQSPESVIAALDGATRDLAEPQRHLAREAAQAAREMARAIEALDREQRDLARSVDPAERSRLEERVAALGAPSDDEPSSTRQMRQLLENQLALMSDMTARLQEIANRRGRYIDLLRTLWLQVSSLRAEQARDALGVSEVSGRIRELCQDVEHAIHGERAVRQVLERPNDVHPVKT